MLVMSDNNSLLMIKLVFGSKNKIIKHQKRSFKELREVIRASFPEAPLDYSLSYLDEDKDQICLNSDSDLSNMLNSKLKVFKIYIKESLSQSIVIDVERSGFIQPSFDNSIIEENPKAEQIPERNLLKQALSEPTEVSVHSKPEQKGQPENKQEPKQAGSVVNKNEKEEVEIAEQQVKKSKKDEFVEIAKQKLAIVEVIQEYPQPVKAVKLQLAADKRVVSKVDQYIKQQPKGKQPEPINAEVQKAKIFQKKEQPRWQKKQQVLQVHHIICSGCKDEFGILGIRYQCILCKHFNLCSSCQAEHDHQHALLKVKFPKQVITDDLIIQKFRKEIYMPEQKAIPDSNFIPSISKEDALRILETARQASENGLNRTKNLIEELFLKMELSHNNPYQVLKPLPSKQQTSEEKAKYLSEFMEINQDQALRFVNSYPSNFTKQRILETYLVHKK